MMNKKTFSPRIVKRARNGYYSYTLSVCFHERSKISGSPTHKQLMAIPAFKSTEVNDLNCRQRVYKQIDKELMRLMIQQGLTGNERTRILRKFAEVIKPLTKAELSSTPPTPPTVSQTLSDKFPVLRS